MRCAEEAVVPLLRRGSQFLHALLHRATTRTAASHRFDLLSLSAALSAQYASPSAKCSIGTEVHADCLDLALRSAAVGPFAAELHTAERAALVTALLPKPQWNNSVLHSLPPEAFAALERSTANAMASLLHLPSRFLWANDPPTRDVPSGAVSARSGGGVLHDSALESLLVVLGTARAQSLSRYVSSRFSTPEDAARVSRRLVLYCSDQSDPLLRRAARCVGIPHIRLIPTVYVPSARGHPLPVEVLRARVAEDAANGLYPMLVSGVFGSRFGAAVDPLSAMAALCGRFGIWFHVDASHAGLAVCADGPTRRAKAGEAVWAQRVAEFGAAAAHADSVHVGASSFLPPFTSGCVASVLFLAHMAKAEAAMRRGVFEEAEGNAWGTPAATPLTLLRVNPPELRTGATTQLALTLAQYNADTLGALVRHHQARMRRVEHMLRADGRFDCAIHASDFGMALFRWLALADEETMALMWRWRDILVARGGDSVNGDGYPVPCVSLGLTWIQRRVYICVGMAGEGEEVLMDTLREAAAAAGDVASLPTDSSVH